MYKIHVTTNTHTDTYVCVCACVCGCERKRDWVNRAFFTINSHEFYSFSHSFANIKIKISFKWDILIIGQRVK